MNLHPVLKPQYFDSNGDPLAGGKLYTYISGTTTPQATYTDSAGGTANTNPIILDANGRCDMWLDPDLSYKFVMYDADDVLQWTVDGVAGLLAPGTVATESLQDGILTADADGRAKMADGYVNTAKLLDGLLTADATGRAKMADGFVNTAKLLDGLLTADATGRAKMADGFLTEAKLSPTNMAGGRLLATYIYTVSDTYTKNADARYVKVTVVGGGGGGGGADITGASEVSEAGGGGSGGTAIKVIQNSSLGATETVTVGEGGAGPAGENDGETGGTSSFGAHCSAVGGTGGLTMAAGTTNAIATGGSGGSASGGDINLRGNQGGNGRRYTSVSSGYGGSNFGAPSFFGGAVVRSSNNGDGPAGLAYGSGGGGARSTGTTGAPAYEGGDGADGVVIVEEYA